MKDLITNFQTTGPCTVDVDKVAKAWNNEFSISQWEKDYRLIRQDAKDPEICAKVTISNEQAEEIILKLNLLPIQSTIFRSGATYRSKGSIESELKRFRVIHEEKSNELRTITDVVNSYSRALENNRFKNQIENESNYNAWKIAKNSLNERDEIGDDFKKNIVKFESDHWKKAFTDGLSYIDEYLCIMQYGLINTVNAEMARSHGKGTFGYRNRGITEEEHKKMDEIIESNFRKYLCTVDVSSIHELYEGVSQNGEGGYYFEELEDK